MIKAFNKYTLAVTGLCVFLTNAYAQSIVYSSDQWPKRWERAMFGKPMMYRNKRGHSNSYVQPRTVQRSDYKKVSQRRRQGWGQQPEEKRYTRSKTPDYNYRSYNENFNSAANPQPYAIPGGVYYGVSPAYPSVYPGVYPAYPNILAPNLVTPGLGGLGFPYTTPLLMAPGLAYPGGSGFIGGYPTGLGYPGTSGYPW